MQLIRKSGANRTKVLATSTPPNIYYKWNAGQHRYVFVVEIYDNATGFHYRMEGGQVEWTTAIEELQKKFAEAPAS